MAGTFPLKSFPVTITSGTSKSNGITVGAGDVVGVEMSAGWDTAGLTFEVSIDGTTYYPLYDDGGNEVKATVAAGQHVSFGEGTNTKAEHFRGSPYIKLRSGTLAAPVNQTADRVLNVVVRKMLAGPMGM